MTDILPEPINDNEPVVSTHVENEPKPRNPQNRRTMWVLVAIVIIALLCLLAGYIYDLTSNRDHNGTRKSDLAYISSTLNQYHDLHGNYPTLAQLNSTTFEAFAPSLNISKFKDPNTNSPALSSQPSSSSYAYQVTPVDCNDTTLSCTGYKLIATLSDGSLYTITSQSTTK